MVLQGAEERGLLALLFAHAVGEFGAVLFVLLQGAGMLLPLAFVALQLTV